MRVGIVGLLQESNTFIDARTRIEDFEADVIAAGAAVRERFEGAHHEIGGFFEGLEEAGIEAVPVFAARALPAGVIAAADFEALLARMLAALESAGPLDGLLAAPHGATVSEAHLDADGFWLRLLRQRLGPRRPLVATIDPHANLSGAMVETADAIVAYRTNPHVDQRERGLEAARLLARTLRGEVRPVLAASFPPLAINIERQSTAEEPLRSVIEFASRLGARPGALSTGVVLGFPFSDVPEMGSAAVAVADGDPRLARSLADAIGDELWRRREDFRGRAVPLDAAIEQARSLPGPVGLLDIGDNVGGGSPGDGTVLARALLERGLGPALASLCDPGAVEAAEAAGIGARRRLRVGGKTDSLHGAPLDGDFEILSLFDGAFSEAAIRHGGFQRFDQGRCALLRHGPLALLAASRRVPPFSLGQLACGGIDPTAFRFLVLKGVHAPLAAYAPVCRSFIRVDTPGVTTADLARLEFRRRRRPLFPFEAGFEWRPPCGG